MVVSRERADRGWRRRGGDSRYAIADPMRLWLTLARSDTQAGVRTASATATRVACYAMLAAAICAMVSD